MAWAYGGKSSKIVAPAPTAGLASLAPKPAPAPAPIPVVAPQAPVIAPAPKPLSGLAGLRAFGANQAAAAAKAAADRAAAAKAASDAAAAKAEADKTAAAQAAAAAATAASEKAAAEQAAAAQAAANAAKIAADNAAAIKATKDQEQAAIRARELEAFKASQTPIVSKYETPIEAPVDTSKPIGAIGSVGKPVSAAQAKIAVSSPAGWDAIQGLVSKYAPEEEEYEDETITESINPIIWDDKLAEIEKGSYTSFQRTALREKLKADKAAGVVPDSAVYRELASEARDLGGQLKLNEFEIRSPEEQAAATAKADAKAAADAKAKADAAAKAKAAADAKAKSDAAAKAKADANAKAASNAKAKGYSIQSYEYGPGGDAGTSTGYSLVDPDGNAVAGLVPQYDDYGGIIGYGALIAGSGDSGSDSIVPVDLNAINAKLAKGNVPFGTGMGPALGYEYGMKNSEGDIFRKFDKYGNLKEYLDQHGVFQKASDFKPEGLVFNPMTGNLETEYKSSNPEFLRGTLLESNAASINPYHEDQGGWLGEGGWNRLAGLALAALSAGAAGGAFANLGIGSAFGSTAAAANPILTAATQSALTSMAATGLQGGSYSEMLQAGLKAAAMAGLSEIASAELIGGLEKTVDMNTLSGGGFELGDAGGTFSGLVGDAGGSMSYEDLVNMIGSSSNNIVGGADNIASGLSLINDAYKSNFGREANEQDLEYWAKDIQSGASIEDVLNNINTIASQVGTQTTDTTAPTKGTSESDIANIYQNILGRDPDAEGLKYWLSTGETPEQIENNIRLIEKQNIANFYKDILGREPDAEGLEYWANSGNTLEEIARNIGIIAGKGDVGDAVVDTITGGKATDTITGGTVVDTITGGTATDTIGGGTVVDTITGGTATDTITGGKATDIADIIGGGTVVDTITGDTVVDTIGGGTATDTITGGTVTDTITGGTDNDTIGGGTVVDTTGGGTSTDTITGGGFTDVLDYLKEQDDEERRKKNGQEALGLLAQMGSGSVKTPEPAKIEYMFDIGGESMFATPKQESLMPSPFEETPEAVEGVRPYYQYFQPGIGYTYAEGGLIGGDDMQTIDDLYEMLRSK